MHRPDLPLRAGLVLVVVLATFLLGYPAAYLASHGLDARVWPFLRGTPPTGSRRRAAACALGSPALSAMAGTYLNMALGRAQALPGGGREASFSSGEPRSRSAPSSWWAGASCRCATACARFGDAHFASPRALAACARASSSASIRIPSERCACRSRATCSPSRRRARARPAA